MMKVWYILLLGLMISNYAGAQEEVILKGKILDEETGEELIGVNIVVYRNDHYIAGTSTDFDGNYELKLVPGIYDVDVSYIGYPPNRVAGVVVIADKENILNVKLNSLIDYDQLRFSIIRCINVPIVDQDPGSNSLNEIDQWEIKRSPHKRVPAITLGGSPGITGGF